MYPTYIAGQSFAQKQFRPLQVVLLGQDVCKDFSTAQVAREIGISRQTVLSIRRVLQDAAQMLQPEDALPDTEIETDEMFQNAGEKGDPHLNPSDPHRVGAGINAEVMALMQMTAHPLSER